MKTYPNQYTIAIRWLLTCCDEIKDQVNAACARMVYFREEGDAIAETVNKVEMDYYMHQFVQLQKCIEHLEAQGGEYQDPFQESVEEDETDRREETEDDSSLIHVGRCASDSSLN